MGGRAFILLKVGRIGPESSKQTEIRLAYLLKILRISRFGTSAPSIVPERAATVVAAIPAEIPRDMTNLPHLPALLFRSQFQYVNWCSIPQQIAGRR
jgi:hypothetical protein